MSALGKMRLQRHPRCAKEENWMCAEPWGQQTAESLQEVRWEGWTGVHWAARVREETDPGWTEKGKACHAQPLGHSASHAEGRGVKRPRNRDAGGMRSERVNWKRPCADPGGPGLASQRRGHRAFIVSVSPNTK